MLPTIDLNEFEYEWPWPTLTYFSRSQCKNSVERLIQISCTDLHNLWTSHSYHHSLGWVPKISDLDLPLTYFSRSQCKISLIYTQFEPWMSSNMNDCDLHLTYCSKSQWIEIVPVPTCCKLHAHNYLPRRRRPGTGDIATPPVHLSVCLSVRHV